MEKTGSSAAQVFSSKEELEEYVADHAMRILKFKRVEQTLNKAKKIFNETMELYFQENDIENKLEFVDVSMGSDSREMFGVSVTRVQKSTVHWHVKELVKTVGKKLARKIITKRYEVIDMQGLIAYLKECGVDPAVFKTFIKVIETVNEKELDRLEALGKIEADDLMDCCEVETKDPYFIVRVKKES